jgi:hypothetical protein
MKIDQEILRDIPYTEYKKLFNIIGKKEFEWNENNGAINIMILVQEADSLRRDDFIVIHEYAPNGSINKYLFSIKSENLIPQTYFGNIRKHWLTRRPEIRLNKHDSKIYIPKDNKFLGSLLRDCIKRKFTDKIPVLVVKEETLTKYFPNEEVKKIKKQKLKKK